MKKALCVAAVAAIFILSVSAAVAATARDLLQEDIPPAKELYQQVVSLPQTDENAPALPEPEQTFDQATSIRILDGESIRELTMQEYLQGVVLGEMPVSFELEALKAQAVAARTFTLKTSQAEKHDGADVCTDSACCQAWTDVESAALKEEDRAKLLCAVSQTDGQVMTYDGELIDATYFSCSGGMTESAVAVWGNDVPYLRSVESPGEEGATRYEGKTTVDKGVFVSIICSAAPETVIDKDPNKWFGEVSYTDGGGVDTMEIGGSVFTGPQLRSLFGLNSTIFTVEVTDEAVVFDTKGFGHRVGMSQYGANARASFGAKYDAILTYYYIGAQLKTLSPS